MKRRRTRVWRWPTPQASGRLRVQTHQRRQPISRHRAAFSCEPEGATGSHLDRRTFGGWSVSARPQTGIWLERREGRVRGNEMGRQKQFLLIFSFNEGVKCDILKAPRWLLNLFASWNIRTFLICQSLTLFFFLIWSQFGFDFIRWVILVFFSFTWI